MAVSNQWRVYITANNGNGTFTGVAELEMASEPGGIDLCEGGTPISSSDHGTFGKDRAFDGILNSTTFGWITLSGQIAPAWIGYEFASPVQIQEFRIFSNEDGLAGGNDEPRDFVLQYFDGSVWVDVDGASYTGEVSWTNYEERVFVGDLSILANFWVSGKTTVDSFNVPRSMLIYCHDMVSGEMVASGVSDPITGDFQIDCEQDAPVFIRAVDPEGIYNTIISENVTPLEAAVEIV